MINDRIIRVVHSPDPDDAFMFYGLSSGKVKLEGIIIEHLLEDIQSLNIRAMRGERGKKALETLFKLGTERKLIPPVKDIQLF